MTSKAEPLPKLRVTCFSCTEVLPQCAQLCSAEVDGDDDELTSEADFDNRFAGRSVECDPGDDTLDFTGLRVALVLGDLPSEEDVFEIED